MIESDIKEFQRQHTNHLGKPLKVDGVQGPQTEWALDFVTLCEARRTIVLAAQQHIGLCEDPPGSNGDRAGLIHSWLSRCYAPVGSPWCAAFASWCLSQGLAQMVREARAQALGRRFAATTQPVAGDLFWFPTGSRSAGTGHVGIIIGATAQEVLTVEGNCANAVRCVRRDRAALRFSRTVEDTSGTAPGVVPSVLPPPRGTR